MNRRFWRDMSNKINMQNNYELMLEQLNAHIYYIDEKEWFRFNFLTDGFADRILFENEVLWNSDEDDRPGVGDEKQPLLDYIKDQFNEHADRVYKLKFPDTNSE